jgi:hypothetical protein
LQGREASAVPIHNRQTCIDLLVQINNMCSISERPPLVIDRSRLCAGENAVTASGVCGLLLVISMGRSRQQLN